MRIHTFFYKESQYTHTYISDVFLFYLFAVLRYGDQQYFKRLDDERCTALPEVRSTAKRTAKQLRTLRYF